MTQSNILILYECIKIGENLFLFFQVLYFTIDIKLFRKDFRLTSVGSSGLLISVSEDDIKSFLDGL